MRPLAAALCFLMFATAVAAQDAATLAVAETELQKRAIDVLHQTADLLQAQKQHGRALALRREIWMDYDENDKRARTRTGFVQVGSLWRLDENKAVIDRDLKGKASKIRKIDRTFAKQCSELCAEHRAVAEGWTKQGEPQRAARHWRRVLRFVPGDEQAAQALAIREFEGFTGTANELHMLRRGRAIHGAVDWLNRFEFATEVLEEQRMPLLEQAGLEHTGVQSETFTIWGTLPPASLQLIAQDCERSLLLARTLFSIYGGERFVPKTPRNMVFTTGKGEYDAAMEVVKGQFSADRFRFLRDEVDQCFIHHSGEALRLHKVEDGIELARDQAVRGVMQDVLGIKTNGLWEGIGHAACGFLFGKTLTFLLEQQTQRTAASWTPKTLAPDLDVWMQIAQESAWSKSDTRTSELVLINASRFTTEQRVKAWAICHYLVHWRPQYVLELDQSKSPSVRTPPEVEAEFLRRTKYELPRIDAEWRTFWARSEELRAAMARDPLPNEKAKNRKSIERSRDLVDAINAQRAAAQVGPLGYFLDASTDFLAVRQYEKALAKALKEQKKRDRLKKKGRKVEPVEMPKVPSSVDRTVLYSRAADAEQAVLQWLARPDLRDQMLHPGRELLSVASDVAPKGSGFLLGTALPAIATTRGAPLAWPRTGQSIALREVRVADLGVRARAALEAAGVALDGVVGAPFSVHFLRAVPANVLQNVSCTAFDGNRPIEGTMVFYGRREQGDDVEVADGCAAFVPHQPLRSGAKIEVRWQVPSVELPQGRRMPEQVFTVE